MSGAGHLPQVRSRWLTAGIMLFVIGGAGQMSNWVLFLIYPAFWTFWLSSFPGMMVFLGVVFLVRGIKEQKEFSKLVETENIRSWAVPAGIWRRSVQKNYRLWIHEFRSSAYLILAVFIIAAWYISTAGNHTFWLVVLAVSVLTGSLFVAVYAGWFYIGDKSGTMILSGQGWVLADGMRIQFNRPFIAETSELDEAWEEVRLTTQAGEKRNLPFRSIGIPVISGSEEAQILKDLIGIPQTGDRKP